MARSFPLAQCHHPDGPVAVLKNRYGEDELTPKLGRVLDLNRWRFRLESQLVDILAEAVHTVGGK